MKKVKIILPEVEVFANRAQKCIYRGLNLLNSHGRRKRNLKDEGGLEVEIRRFLCSSCYRSFSSYPLGVSSLHQPKRLVALSSLLYSLGLSLRSISIVFELLNGIILSKSTVWRNIQRLGGNIRRRILSKARIEKVAGIDQTHIRIKGETVLSAQRH